MERAMNLIDGENYSEWKQPNYVRKEDVTLHLGKYNIIHWLANWRLGHFNSGCMCSDDMERKIEKNGNRGLFHWTKKLAC